MTYLSVDLDYWILDIDQESSIAFFQNIFEREIPFKIVKEHQELLPFVDESGCTKLINVDWHSDLADTPFTELNEGTWVNAVTWRTEGSYQWVHPSSVGWSSLSGSCFAEVDPFAFEEVTEWSSLKKTSQLESIDWDSIKEVGISFSPDWVNIFTVKNVLKDLCKKDGKILQILQEYRISFLENKLQDKPKHVYKQGYYEAVAEVLST